MTYELKKAKELLDGSNVSLVYVKNGITYTSIDRGVSPLLKILDEREDMADAVFADKVIGKGAAFIYVLLGVREIYAKVISTPAKELLLSHGISLFFDTETKNVRNRAGTDLCPIESAVLFESDPKKALSLIRKRLNELK